MMSPTKKIKVLNQLKTIRSLIQKCGGPGGTPGPCPIGGRGKPAGKKPVGEKKSEVDSGDPKKNLSPQQVSDFAKGLKKGDVVRIHLTYKTPIPEDQMDEYPKGASRFGTTQTAQVTKVTVKNGQTRVSFGPDRETKTMSMDLMSHIPSASSVIQYKAEILGD